MKTADVLATLYNQPWLIQPGKLEELCAAVAAGVPTTEDAGDAALRNCAYDLEAIEAGQTIAVLPFFGACAQHRSWYGPMSTEAFLRDFHRALGDPQVGKILFHVHSPGGQVYGVQELSDAIFRARGTKPMEACANSLMASAALWIFTAADKLWVTPGGELGSHGVLTMHVDWSKFEETVGIKTTLIATPRKKVEGNPYEPLSAEALAEIERVNQIYYTRFSMALARNRGVTVKAAVKNFGGGGMLLAEEAVAAGLADGVATVHEVLARMAGQGKRSGRRKAANDNALKLAESG